MQEPTRGKKRKRRRRMLMGAVAMGLIAALCVGAIVLAGQRAARLARQDGAGDVVAAFVGDLSASVSASGHLEPAEETQLSVRSPGVVDDVYVRAGDRVRAGDALLQLETDDLALQVARAEQSLALSEANLEALLTGPDAGDVAAAEAAVHSAQANLDNLLAGPSEEDVAASEADVRAQEASVAAATAAYNTTLDSISDAAIAAARADLVEAQIAYDRARETDEKFPWVTTHDAFLEASDNLEIAQTALDELLDGPNQGKVSSAAASVSAAQAGVDQAKAQHEQLLSGPSASQIAAARANLAQARDKLARLTVGASEAALTVARAEVEQAQLTLADAREALDNAMIVAPFDGMVTDVSVAPGEYATGGVVRLVSSELYVLLKVDQVDMGALQVGQPAVVTMETWPDVEIAGAVASIAPSADVGMEGTVSFDVRLNLEESELPVLGGMTANARLVTAQHENVLLVPNAALTADRKAGTYSVNRVVGEADGSPVVETLPVTIGLRDDDFTEITGGLKQGDEVLIGELKAPGQGFGLFGGR
jgi:HlyD family secretion protein